MHASSGVLTLVESSYLPGMLNTDAICMMSMQESTYKKINNRITSPDLLITTMTPALDTVWVGMASGRTPHGVPRGSASQLVSSL